MSSSTRKRKNSRKPPRTWRDAVTFERVVQVLGIVVPIVVAIISRPRADRS